MRKNSGFSLGSCLGTKLPWRWHFISAKAGLGKEPKENWMGLTESSLDEADTIEELQHESNQYKMGTNKDSD